MRLTAGDLAPRLRMVDVEGKLVMLGRGKRRTLLCFFGDAACAFCNVYIHDLIGRYRRLTSLGLDATVVYNASQESVWRFVSGRPRPFPIVADPASIAHRTYGVERSLRGKLKGVVARTPIFLKGLRMVGAAGINADTTMPADFLIDAHGRIAEAHYGTDPADHIPFQRVEAFAEHGSADAAERIQGTPSMTATAGRPRTGAHGRRTLTKDQD